MLQDKLTSNNSTNARDRFCSKETLQISHLGHPGTGYVGRTGEDLPEMGTAHAEKQVVFCCVDIMYL